MEPIGIVVDWLKTNSGKIILLIVVALLAAVIDKALTRIVSKVRERNGNVKIIPNSILNTASLEKLNPSNEMLVRVPFTAKAGTDIDEMTRQVVQAVQRDTADLADPRFPPKVRLTGYSPYGINVEVCAYAKPESLLPDMINAVARSIANADFLENRAINKES